MTTIRVAFRKASLEILSQNLTIGEPGVSRPIATAISGNTSYMTYTNGTRRSLDRKATKRGSNGGLERVRITSGFG
jgi:hypothetical protein